MEQLTEMDNNFVQQESARTPMHISPVLIYDQSSRTGGKVRFKEILTVFERNLHKSAIFRRKLAGRTFGLDTPYWVEDPDFDLEFHVRHLALPKPGDWRQFCILLARLQARGLDMKRPLWEAYVIEGLNGVEGLPDNSFAIMLKIHHAAIDGVSGAEILTAIHSLTDEVEPPEVEDNWRPEAAPGAWKVWSRAYVNNLRRPVKFFETVGSLVPAILRAGRLSQPDEAREPRRPLGVKTRFNNRISSGRVTEALILDLDEVKRIRRAVGGDVTINDIAVAIIGGAMRKYLQSKGELPAESLTAGAPVDVRDERGSESRGNQVSLMMISMATNVADPLERLAAVHKSAVQSKALTRTLGTSVLMDLFEILIPQVVGWGFSAVTMAAQRAERPMPCQTVISNIPGPQFPIYLAGARVSMVMGMGVLLDMMGLFHAVLSGAGHITINFLSCRDMLPDPQFYKACLEESYQELRSAALQSATRKAKSGQAAKRKATRAAGGKKRGTKATGSTATRKRPAAT